MRNESVQRCGRAELTHDWPQRREATSTCDVDTSYSFFGSGEDLMGPNEKCLLSPGLNGSYFHKDV